uniref:Uncharacterized protein n=1 Tax=viral metagenome TaxID=1070528 RepID=A0A6M3LUX3_9ZZZZ
MTDKEIFIAAHEKAYPGSKEEVWEIFFKFRGCTIKAYNYITSAVITSIIFNHDFAKAFWRIEQFPDEHRWKVSFRGMFSSKSKEYIIDVWQYHLQQMVLCEKPLKYIEQFLRKGETD